jgi:hypothetical protein
MPRSVQLDGCLADFRRDVPFSLSLNMQSNPEEVCTRAVPICYSDFTLDTVRSRGLSLTKDNR